MLNDLKFTKTAYGELECDACGFKGSLAQLQIHSCHPCDRRSSNVGNLPTFDDRGQPILLPKVSAETFPQHELDDVEKESVFEILKEDVNQFLWTRLPGRCTIARADEVAGQIYELLEKEWDTI